MIVVRKVLGAVLWYIILLILVFVGVGIWIALQLDLSLPPEELNANAEALGYEFGLQYGDYLIYGPLVVAVLGSLLGILPFTRHSRRK